MRHRFGLITAAGIALGVVLVLAGCQGEVAESESITPPPPTAAGVLDMDFGGTGFVTSDPSIGWDDVAHAIAVTGNNSVVVAGSSSNGGLDLDLAVWRYAPSGNPDISFAGVGRFFLDQPNGTLLQEARALKLLPDGSMLIGGETDNGTSIEFAAWHLLGNGTGLNTSFGSPNGYISPAISGSAGADSGHAIGFDDAKNVIIAGVSDQGVTFFDDMVIVKRLSDGNSFSSFAASGTYIWNNATENGFDVANALAIDADANTTDTDDNIAIAGSSDESGLQRIAVWRLTALGAPVSGFGSGGVYFHIEAPPTGAGVANAIVRDSAGRFIVAGAISNGTDNDAIVIRLSSTGVPDTNFGTNGVVKLTNIAGAPGNDEFVGVVIDGAGRIILAGNGNGPGANGRDIAVVRLTAKGVLDSSFGSNGIVTHHGAAGGVDDRARAIALDTLGRILVTGNSTTSSPDEDMAIWRFK